MRRVLVAVGLVLAGGLAAGFQKPDEAAAVRKVLDDQAVAWNAGNLEGFMAGYSKKSLTFFSGGNVERGWQATYDRYRKAYQADGREMGKLEFSDLAIQQVGPDAAFVTGRWKLALKDGKAPGGLYTLLLRKEPEGWRIVHDHTSKAD